MKHLIALLLLVATANLAAQDIPELDHRIQLSIDRLTDLDRQPAFTEDFLLADVRLNPEDPRRFYNFSGDLSGRYLEVMALVPEEQRGTLDLNRLVQFIAAEQKADGRFGDDRLDFTTDGEHMALLWGNSKVSGPRASAVSPGRSETSATQSTPSPERAQPPPHNYPPT